MLFMTKNAGVAPTNTLFQYLDVQAYEGSLWFAIVQK
jgi:hypothetical protein